MPDGTSPAFIRLKRSQVQDVHLGPLRTVEGRDRGGCEQACDVGRHGLSLDTSEHDLRLVYTIEEQTDENVDGRQLLLLFGYYILRALRGR